jgi:hypothetical protein
MSTQTVARRLPKWTASIPHRKLNPEIATDSAYDSTVTGE